MTMQEETKEKYKARLKQFDAEMDKLSVKIDEAEADAKVHFKKIMAETREQREDIAERFEELSKASGDAFKELQHGFERAWDRMSDGFKAHKDKGE